MDGEFVFTVKTEFLKTCPEPHKIDEFELLSSGEYRMAEFLHNETGPACIHLPTKQEAFYLDGVECSDDQIKRIKHGHEFHETLDKVLSSEEK